VSVCWWPEGCISRHALRAELTISTGGQGRIALAGGDCPWATPNAAGPVPLEGDGFGLPVPREKGWSFDGSLSSAPFKSPRVSTKTTRLLHEGPIVRIRLPPPASQSVTISSAPATGTEASAESLQPVVTRSCPSRQLRRTAEMVARVLRPGASERRHRAESRRSSGRQIEPMIISSGSGTQRDV
jgi:hypothetical protein